MSVSLSVSLLGVYLYLGWCWAGVLLHFAVSPLTRTRFFLTLLLWPVSLILTDADIEDDTKNIKKISDAGIDFLPEPPLTLDIQALKTAALAATPGVWHGDDGFIGHNITCVVNGWNTLLANVESVNAKADMAFIALANPQNILSLLSGWESDKALIAEQARRIAELEARTVSLMLADTNEEEGDEQY